MNKLTELKPITAAELRTESGWEISDSAAVMIDENGVIQKIKPDSYLWPKTIENTIKEYVNDQIEYFRSINHISKRAWNKRGIIIKESQHLGLLTYQLVYKTIFKNCTQKIKFSTSIWCN
jgi:hypothetical protein